MTLTILLPEARFKTLGDKIRMLRRSPQDKASQRRLPAVYRRGADGTRLDVLVIE
ncbi:MAG TPA: hypothetical protein VK731_11995 [Candidatus Cybelea sp.]|nr:hypothetical protein [Candidatus Cybelea sp.]